MGRELGLVNLPRLTLLVAVGAAFLLLAESRPAPAIGAAERCPPSFGQAPERRGPENGQIVPLRGLDSLLVCGYRESSLPGIPEEGATNIGKLDLVRRTRANHRVKSLARALDGLDPFRAGTYNCGSEYGGGTNLRFGYEDGPAIPVFLRSSRCPSASNGARYRSYQLTKAVEVKLSALIGTR